MCIRALAYISICSIHVTSQVKLPVQVAGFAENQDYGVGFNTWTSGQKAGADLKQCAAPKQSLICLI